MAETRLHSGHTNGNVCVCLETVGCFVSRPALWERAWLGRSDFCESFAQNVRDHDVLERIYEHTRSNDLQPT